MTKDKTVTMSWELADLLLRSLHQRLTIAETKAGVRELCALLAAPVVEAATCAQCKASTTDICNQNGCGYLESGNGAPVVERQPLSVWEGSMPESNGKSNFTVILHTGDLTEGICVYRSEYPDRARYEADCFRHLIGDPAFPEKPFICDYDADKHSGYVKPDTSPPAPVAVVLPDRFHQVMKYLIGIGDLDGYYFRDAHPSGKKYWWRNELLACLDKVKELNQ